MFIRIKYILFLLILTSLTCFSQELVQNDKESKITFKIKNFGLTVDGNFKKVRINSNFDSDNLKGSYLNTEIKVNSIFTDSKSRDDHLLQADYFDVNKYPKIIFTSTEILKTIKSKYIVKGFISIKGVQKKIEAPLEITNIKGGIIILANFTLNRKDFGVGGSSFVLSKNVNIKMKYVAKRN